MLWPISVPQDELPQNIMLWPECSRRALVHIFFNVYYILFSYFIHDDNGDNNDNDDNDDDNHDNAHINHRIENNYKNDRNYIKKNIYIYTHVLWVQQTRQVGCSPK